MATSFKRSHACTYCYTHYPQPCSRPPLTHTSTSDSWTLLGKSGSVSCGVTAPFSWVLVHKVLFVPSKSISQSCLSLSSSLVGLMATSSKRAYAIPKSAAPRAPDPVAKLPHTSIGDAQTQSVSIFVGSLGPGAHKVCLSPLSISGGNGV